MLDRLLSYPARLRRSHGFGVHSPFAYRFITKVLREKEAQYYAYGEIAAFCPRVRKASFNEIFAGKDISIPEAHLLFRILCFFNPGHVLEVGHGHEVTHVILSRAVPNAAVHTWDSSVPPELPENEGSEPFVLVNQVAGSHMSHLAGEIISQIGKHDCVVVVRNIRHLPSSRRLWEKLLEFSEFGMAFTDGYMGILVARRSLPFHIYEIVL